MASSRASTSKSPSLSTATAKTRSAIQDLQNRLVEVSQTEPARSSVEDGETEQDLERQLESYFAHHASCERTPVSSADELRNRVIDGVVERILSEWASGKQAGAGDPGLRDEVLERLIERVLQQLRSNSTVLF